jgi:hypothetical protein
VNKVKRLIFLLISGCLIAGGLKAAPPRCETKKFDDGQIAEVCERADAICQDLVAAQLKKPFG